MRVLRTFTTANSMTPVRSFMVTREYPGRRACGIRKNCNSFCARVTLEVTMGLVVGIVVM